MFYNNSYIRGLKAHHISSCINSDMTYFCRSLCKILNCVRFRKKLSVNHLGAERVDSFMIWLSETLWLFIWMPAMIVFVGKLNMAVFITLFVKDAKMNVNIQNIGLYFSRNIIINLTRTVSRTGWSLMQIRRHAECKSCVVRRSSLCKFFCRKVLEV